MRDSVTRALMVKGLSLPLRAALLASDPAALYTFDGTGALVDLQGTAPDLTATAYGGAVITRGGAGLAPGTGESLNVSGTGTAAGAGLQAVDGSATRWASGDFTFEITVRPSALPAAGEWSFVAMHGGGSQDNYWFGFRNEGGTMTLECKVTGLTFAGQAGATAAASDRLQVPYDFTVGEEYVLAWRFTNGRCDVFVNGEKQSAHGTYTGTPTPNTGDRSTLLSYNSGGSFSFGFHGDADEAAYFFSAPTDSEMAGWYVTAPAAPPAQLYVATTGSDSNDGLTPATALATLNAADALAGPGTTVTVADGTYPAARLSAMGTSSERITYQAENPGGAVIAAASSTTGLALAVDGEYTDVLDFEVTGGSTGIAVRSSNIAVRGCEVHAVCQTDTPPDGGAGINVFTDGYVALENVEVTGNVVHDVGLTIAAAQTVQGIYLAVPCQGGKVENNVVYGVQDFGIHCFHNPRYWEIVNNTISLCGRGILACPDALVANNIVDRIGADGATGDGYDVAVNTDGGAAPTVHTNLMHSAAGADAGFTVADPLFTSAPTALGDAFDPAFFHLGEGSPAIDAGTGADAPATDAEGTTRPQGASVDIGAYEAGPGAYATAVLASSPAMYLRLPGLTDQAGANDGTAAGGPASGTSLITSGGDGSLVLDGVDDEITVADDASLDTAAFTLEAWVSVDVGAADFDVLAMKTTSSAWNDGWGLHWQNGGLRFWVNDYNIQSAGFSNHIEAALTTGVVHHVVCVRDASAIHMYVDGVEVAGSPLSLTGATELTATPLTIGSGPGGGFLAATVDELVFYPAALDATTIADRHTLGTA